MTYDMENSWDGVFGKENPGINMMICYRVYNVNIETLSARSDYEVDVKYGSE